MFQRDEDRHRLMNNNCPTCSSVITHVGKSTLLNSILAEVLKAQGHRQRPEADLRKLDKKNKFTKEELERQRKSIDSRTSFDIEAMFWRRLEPRTDVGKRS